MLTKVNDMDILMEDSLDGGPSSVGSGDIPAAVVATPGGTTSTPVTVKKVKQNTNSMTVFFLYFLFFVFFCRFGYRNLFYTSRFHRNPTKTK